MFKVQQHDGLIYRYCETMTSVGSANIHLLVEIQEKLKKEEKKKGKGFLLVMKTLRIYSVNFGVYQYRQSSYT